MSANVESMFYVRETPWHGLGTRVMEAPSSIDALRIAGLNWQVLQEPIYTDGEESPIEGYKANVRDLDRKVLGGVQTVTGSSRTRKLLPLPMNSLEKGSAMRLQEASRAEKRSGFWQECLMSTLFPGNVSPLTLFSSIPMMVPAR